MYGVARLLYGVATSDSVYNQSSVSVNRRIDGETMANSIVPLPHFIRWGTKNLERASLHKFKPNRVDRTICIGETDAKALMK